MIYTVINGQLHIDVLQCPDPRHAPWAIPGEEDPKDTADSVVFVPNSHPERPEETTPRCDRGLMTEKVEHGGYACNISMYACIYIYTYMQYIDRQDIKYYKYFKNKRVCWWNPSFPIVRTHGLACGPPFFAGENRLFLPVNLACPLVANLQLGFHWDLLNARRLSTLNLLEKDWSLKMCLVKSCSPWLRLAIFWCQSLLGQVVHRDDFFADFWCYGEWFPPIIQPPKTRDWGTVGNTGN